MTIFKLSAFWVLFFFAAPLCSQEVYELKWKKEMLIVGTGAVQLAIGQHLLDEMTLFTPDELSTLDASDVNAFDRVATRFNSLGAHRMSNYIFYGSPVLPGLLMLGKQPRSHALTIGLLWFETNLCNGGLTHLSKHAFQRPRPFVFDENTNLGSKLTTNAKASFISGHTSAVAANSFFAARVFSDYYPDSPWKPCVWGVAAALPAITGYLRVRAGRHYPTDTIAGYVVGAAVGIGVPWLHRAGMGKKKQVQLSGGLSGIYMKWRF